MKEQATRGSAIVGPAKPQPAPERIPTTEALTEPAVPEETPNEDAIVVGSTCTSNSIPSLIDTWFTTNVEARLLLEHQSGASVDNIVLRANPNQSSWHIFARICIDRV